MALELLSASKDRMHRPSKDKFVDFHVPSGLNLLEDTEYASQAALWGIKVVSHTTLTKKLIIRISLIICISFDILISSADCLRHLYSLTRCKLKYNLF